MARQDNTTLFNRYKRNGTGNSGTTVNAGGAQERSVSQVSLLIHQAAILGQAQLDNQTEQATFLTNLDTAISTLHTGVAKQPN